MATIELPYGRSSLSCEVPDHYSLHWLNLAPREAAPDPERAVEEALDRLLGEASWSNWAGAGSAAVAVNDKTRPVPHQYLLPPLLERLEGLGLPPQQTKLIIATGAHPPLSPGEYPVILPKAMLDRYPVLCHDAQDTENLQYLGETSRRTPIWINRQFLEAGVRIVVGNIEPHQFMGFSGGIKSAAIGLAGEATIDHNHSLMMNAMARLGEYDRNPARKDVEEIGARIGVHLALNAVLNDSASIAQVLAGEPGAVMQAGVPLARAICQLPVAEPFDLVIASPGGHPKDINLYQAQKGLAHAALVTKTGGAVVLAAACPEGPGSRSYEEWVTACGSQEEVLSRFAAEGFRVGPHKAYQIARDATRVKVLLVSEMAPGLVRRLLLSPAEGLQTAASTTLATLPPTARIGILPRANATIPALGARSGSVP